MKKLLLVLAFCLVAGPSWAQCTGVFPAKTLCGNLGATAAPPAAFTATGTIGGSTVTTSGDVATWGNTTGTLITDSTSISTGQNFIFTGTVSATGLTSLSNTSIVSAAITSTFNFLNTAITSIAQPTNNTTFSGNNTFSGTNSFSGVLAPTGTVSGTAMNSFMASPPPIGSTAPNTGNFTTATGSTFTANSLLCTATVQGVCLANLTSSSVAQVTSAGSMTVQVGAASAFTVNAVGHFAPRTAAVSPAASCAGGTAGAGATDMAGKITMNSGTSCNVFFANAFANPPACVIVPGTQGNTSMTTTTTGFSATMANASTTFNYMCMGL